MTRREPPSEFVVRLRPLPGVDAIRALRQLLKVALRRFGLKCVSIAEQKEHDNGGGA
jgi:hypothetical protein